MFKITLKLTPPEWYSLLVSLPVAVNRRQLAQLTPEQAILAEFRHKSLNSPQFDRWSARNTQKEYSLTLSWGFATALWYHLRFNCPSLLAQSVLFKLDRTLKSLDFRPDAPTVITEIIPNTTTLAA